MAIITERNYTDSTCGIWRSGSRDCDKRNKPTGPPVTFLYLLLRCVYASGKIRIIARPTISTSGTEQLASRSACCAPREIYRFSLRLARSKSCNGRTASAIPPSQSASVTLSAASGGARMAENRLREVVERKARAIL